MNQPGQTACGWDPHLSAAGGLHKALEAAQGYGFSALALFVRSPRQWLAPPLSDEARTLFLRARETAGVEVIVAHANYLFNLAGVPELRSKSIRALADELNRCSALGIEYLVLHPGSCPDLEAGLERISSGLNEALASLSPGGVTLLLESTAGQGHSIGHRFEHLAEILNRINQPERCGICLDTCHLFAAGYEIRTPEAWNTTMAEFDRIVGCDRLRAFHCNDSKKQLDSRVDRHEHIGAGAIGLNGFANLVNDPRLKEIPLILETPKGHRESDGRDWDEINAETLRSLAIN